MTPGMLKSFYRKACVLVKLNCLDEAINDLGHMNKFDYGNDRVLKKLKKVKNGY